MRKGKERLFRAASDLPVQRQTSGSENAVSAAVRALQLPEDCRKGTALVTINGRTHACVENFKGICSYSEHAVLLKANNSKICIRGKRLRIDGYTKDEIEISGTIEMVSYE